MDYGLRWKISFETEAGEAREVRIYDADWEGDVTALEGGASALETQEATDEDILCPVRGQTGYVCVLDNGDLDGLVPANNLQHFVELVSMNGQTVSGILWAGFMKAAAYSTGWGARPEEVRLPVLSYVEALDGVDLLKDRSMGLVTLGELLYEAASVLDGYYWSAVDYVWVPAEFGTDATDWWKILNMEVSRYNFFEKIDADNDDDPDWTKYETDSYRTVLEKICRLLGWTLREEPRGWTLMSAKVNEYFKLTMTELANLKTTTTKTVTVVEQTVVDVEDMPLDGTDHTLDVLQGCRTMSVSAEIGRVSDVEGIGLDLTGLEYVRPYVDLLVRSDNRYTQELIYDAGQHKVEDESDLVLYAWSGNVTVQGGDVAWTGLPYDPNADSVSGVDGYVLAQICKFDQYLESEVTGGTKISYNYTEGILIRSLVPYAQGGSQLTDGEVPVLRLNGGVLPALTAGCFDLDFAYQAVTTQAVAGHGTWTLVKLQVGGLWWDGLAWTGTETTFGVEIDTEGRVKTTKTLAMKYEGASRKVIPISGMIEGQVSLTIYNNVNVLNVSSGAVLLKDVSLRYCKPETAKEGGTSGKYHYYGSVDNAFKERKKVELAMATTRHDGGGHGLLVYDGAMVDDTTFPQGRMEQWLLGNLKRLFGRYIEKLTLRVRGVELTPRTRLTLDGTDWQVLSVAREWTGDGETVICESLPGGESAGEGEGEGAE